jgi:hypothetical protein
MKDSVVILFYQKKPLRLYMELMDSKVQTTKDIIKKRKKINEFVIYMKHIDKYWFSRTNVALLDSY